VDRKPENALKMAELEHALGVCSTYYFRHPHTFIPEIIEQVLSLGHEVGYHYEVLAKAKGDYEEAIGLFARELEEFRSLCDVRTICMHGSPLSRYDNRDLWKSMIFGSSGSRGRPTSRWRGRSPVPHRHRPELGREALGPGCDAGRRGGPAVGCDHG
jgi:hypothetical protein